MSITSAPAPAKQLTPLEFLIQTANNPDVSLDLRMRAAQAALPYASPKVAPHQIGKKEIDRARAIEAMRGSRFGPPTPTPPGLLPKKRAASKSEAAEDEDWGDLLEAPESAIFPPPAPSAR